MACSSVLGCTSDVWDMERKKRIKLVICFGWKGLRRVDMLRRLVAVADSVPEL